jgi:LmbE family N-acetylglucosaminyl deacetylase
MIHFGFGAPQSHPLQILCLGAHSDDIEIGCGASILRLAAEYPSAQFHWVVFSATGVREAEARRGCALFVKSAAPGSPLLKSFQDGFLPFAGAEVKKAFEDLKRAVSPDLVFTHNRKDAHQDHRLLAELTWNTFRDHSILEYEIPKYDGDMGQPNVFIPVTAETAQAKVRHIMDAFESQRAKRWFQPETFMSLMRLRGMESNSPSGYAEAFYGRKIVL